jgi:hypothetical protein
MIARFTTLLPFVIHVPDGPLPEIAVRLNGGEYDVTYWPPMQALMSLAAIESNRDIALGDIPALIRPMEPQTSSDLVLIDGALTVAADLVQIDIKARAFDRKRSADEEFCDPHGDFLFNLLNSYLSRIRTVTRSPTIRFLDPRSVPWQIEYLDDSGAELPKTGGLVGRRFSWNQRIELAAVPLNSWERIRGLPSLFFPARYDVLILDARAALPETGAAIVLSFTALETLIAAALKRLAGMSSSAPERLWKWINDRGDFRKEPSIAEQFDILLQVLSGKSLRDDPRLWRGFRDLKHARDSFVHEGVAAIGKQQVAVTSGRAGELVEIADEIVRFVEALLPAEARMPRYDAAVNISVGLRRI